MREILFRGKRVDNGEWIYGFYYNIQEIEHYILEPVVLGLLHTQVIPETIGQFTGLLDKKGNKIFENDVVRWDDMSNGKKWRVAVVELYPALQFRIIKIECDFIQSAQEGKVFKFGNFIYTDTHNHLEIIGNIHDKQSDHEKDR